MYNTEWTKSKAEASDTFVEFVETLEEELHDFEGQITVEDVKGKIGAKVEIYNEDEHEFVFNLVEKTAQNTLGTENYAAWTSGNTMTVSV